MPKFQKITREEYRNLFSKALFSTFFHNTEWHEFLEKEFKWLKFEYYSYKDEAVLPLARLKVFGREKLISLPFCEYGGPLPLKKEINFEEFENDLLNEFNNIELKINPGIQDFFKHNGGIVESLNCSYQIRGFNYLNEEKIFRSFRPTTRQRIRKAEKENLVAAVCKTEEELKQFYNAYVKTMKKNKTVCFPFQIFKFLFEISRNSRDVNFFIVKHKSRLISGVVILFYSGIAHNFLTATDYRYVRRNKLNPVYFILWNAMKDILNSKRAEVFDLGGTKINSSLEEFKRGWGAESYPIWRISDFKLSKLKKSRLRKFWGLLPEFMIKTISPYLIKYRL